MAAVPSYGMPSNVQVDAMGDHVRYLLPRRQLGAMRWVGLLPMGTGCVILGILSVMLRPMKSLASADRASRIFAAVLCGFFLLFAVPVLRLMIFGLVVIAGRSEIRLINGRLSARERAGPFFWTRRCKKKTPIQRVSVGYGDGTVTVNGKPTERFSNLARLAALGVEAGPNVKDRFLLTIGYPKEILLAVGQDLAHRMHVGFREGVMKGATWLIPDEEAESTS
jgi:hypothetical protein